MPQRGNTLVEGGVDAGPAYLVDLRLRVEWDRDGFVQLFFGLRNELVGPS